MGHIRAQLDRQRALAASTSLNLPDGGRRLAARIQQLEAELVALTGPAGPSTSLPLEPIDLIGPATPIIDMTSAPLPATVLRPLHGIPAVSNPQPTINLNPASNRPLPRRVEAAGATDLTENDSDSVRGVECMHGGQPSCGPEPVTGASMPAVDLTDARDMPSNGLRPVEAASIDGLTDMLQQQLSITPLASQPDPHHGHRASSEGQAGTRLDQLQPCSKVAPSLQLYPGVQGREPAGTSGMPSVSRRGTDAALQTGRHPGADSRSQPQHPVHSHRDHPATCQERPGSDGAQSHVAAGSHSQASRGSQGPLASITNRPKGAQSHVAAGSHAQAASGSQGPLASITKRPHRHDKQGAASKLLQPPPPPPRSMPTGGPRSQSTQAVPGPPNGAALQPASHSAAHAEPAVPMAADYAACLQQAATPDLLAAAAQIMGQGVVPTEQEQLLGRDAKAQVEAEVALLKHKLQKYCAILASEVCRRDLPDGGLKVRLLLCHAETKVILCVVAERVTMRMPLNGRDMALLSSWSTSHMHPGSAHLP